MGQAKLRGSLEERVKKGIEKRQIEEQRLAELEIAIQKERQEKIANMTPEEKERRLNSTIEKSVMLALLASLRSYRGIIGLNIR